MDPKWTQSSKNKKRRRLEVASKDDLNAEKEVVPHGDLTCIIIIILFFFFFFFFFYFIIFILISMVE